MYVHVHIYICKFHKLPIKTQLCFFKRNILPYNTCAPQNIGQLTFLAFKMLLLYTSVLIQKRLFLSKKIIIISVLHCCSLMRVMKLGRFLEETKSVFNCALKASLQWPFKTA